MNDMPKSGDQAEGYLARWKFIKLELLEEAMAEGRIGFCLACGEEHYGAEPDARGLRCEACGESAVYGAEEIILMGMVE